MWGVQFRLYWLVGNKACNKGTNSETRKLISKTWAASESEWCRWQEAVWLCGSAHGVYLEEKVPLGEIGEDCLFFFKS